MVVGRFANVGGTAIDLCEGGTPLPAGVFVQGDTPDGPAENDTWVDTDTVPPEVRRYVADAWVALEIPSNDGPSFTYLGSAVAANANGGSAASVAVPGGSVAGDLCVLVTGAQHDVPSAVGCTDLATSGRLSFQYKILGGSETTIDTGTSFDWKQMIAVFLRPSGGAAVVIDTDVQASGVALNPDTTDALLAIWAGGGGDGSSGAQAPSGFADISIPAGTGGSQTNLRLAVKLGDSISGADLSAYGGGTVSGAGALSAMTTFKVV